MLASMSSGALLSKTRAMFGRRLTLEDYTVLSQKRDISGAAAYLQSLPAYKDIFEGRDTAGMHRMEVEGLLRHQHFKSFESLCRYELSIGEKFSDYILLTTEIELITECLSRIMSHRTDDAVMFSASPYLDRLLKLDLSAMGKAQTYDEFLAAVKESAFYGVLKGLGWHPDGELLIYENALLSEFYRRIFSIINDSLSGGARETLRDIFTSRIDLENLVRIVRLKDYFFNASPEYIQTALLPCGNVAGNTAVRLTECKDSATALALAGEMKLFRGKLGELDRCRRIDELPDRYMLRRCLHEIYFSPHPSVVMISYLNISEIEVANIIKIVEGIRYGLESEQIMEFLVLPRTDEEVGAGGRS